LMIICSSVLLIIAFFFFSSRRRHTRSKRDWSSDVCSSDLGVRNMSTKSLAWVALIENGFYGLAAKFQALLVFTNGHKFHFGCNHALASIVQLGHIFACLGAQGLTFEVKADVFHLNITLFLLGEGAAWRGKLFHVMALLNPGGS